MIRVLQVIGSLNSGGSQSLMMNIYKHIDRTKIQFDFVIDRPNETFYANEIEKLGGKIYILPQYKLYNHFSYKKEWNKFFKEHPEYKIVHGHVRSTASIYLKIAKKYGLKTIAHSHSTSSGKGIKAIVKNILQKKIRKVADYFMGCSKEANIWLFGKKIANSNNCVILKNGIDIEKFKYNPKIREEMRKKLKINDNDILIGHIARFVKSKNHFFTLEVFKKIYNLNSNYKLLLIGDGELKERIIEKYRNNEFIQNVIIIDVVPNVNEYMQATDIVILPSLYEGLGIVLVEAQVSGNKCLASNSVPKEAKITDNIKFLELNNDIWVNEVLKIGNDYDRQCEILDKSYDIKHSTRILTELYLSIGGIYESKD